MSSELQVREMHAVSSIFMEVRIRSVVSSKVLNTKDATTDDSLTTDGVDETTRYTNPIVLYDSRGLIFDVLVTLAWGPVPL